MLLSRVCRGRLDTAATSTVKEIPLLLYFSIVAVVEVNPNSVYSQLRMSSLLNMFILQGNLQRTASADVIRETTP